MAASTVHDFTGRPSMWTTQAPQLEVSHPQCVPVRPRVSRRKWTSRSAGSISCLTSSRLTLTVTSISSLLVPCAFRRALQGALAELAREMALVVDRPAPVGAGRAVLGGELPRLGEQLLRGLPAA